MSDIFIARAQTYLGVLKTYDVAVDGRVVKQRFLRAARIKVPQGTHTLRASCSDVQSNFLTISTTDSHPTIVVIDLVPVTNGIHKRTLELRVAPSKRVRATSQSAVSFGTAGLIFLGLVLLIASKILALGVWAVAVLASAVLVAAFWAAWRYARAKRSDAELMK